MKILNEIEFLQFFDQFLIIILNSPNDVYLRSLDYEFRYYLNSHKRGSKSHFFEVTYYLNSNVRARYTVKIYPGVAERKRYGITKQFLYKEDSSGICLLYSETQKATPLLNQYFS